MLMLLRKKAIVSFFQAFGNMEMDNQLKISGVLKRYGLNLSVFIDFYKCKEIVKIVSDRPNPLEEKFIFYFKDNRKGWKRFMADDRVFVMYEKNGRLYFQHTLSYVDDMISGLDSTEYERVYDKKGIIKDTFHKGTPKD